MEGWIKLHRKLLESEIWLTKPCSWNKVWIYILSKVNHENNKFFKRGENFFNFTQEIKHIGCDVSYDNIREFLRYAKSTTMITTRKTTRGIVIKVNKYAIYQSKDEIKTTTETTSPTTIKPQQNHNDKQEYKNERSISKDIDDKSSLPTKTNKSNPLINYIITTLKEFNGTRTLDGSDKENRMFAFNLIRCKLKPELKGSGEKEPTDEDVKIAFKTILENMDDFHKKNATSVKYIYNNFNKLIKIK